MNRLVVNILILHFRYELADGFSEELLKCATFFKELQCKVIEKNLKTFNEGYDHKEMRSLRDSVAANFIRTNRVKGIAKNKGLVAAGSSVQRLGQCLNLDERVEAGTFEDKVRKGYCLFSLHPCNHCSSRIWH